MASTKEKLQSTVISETFSLGVVYVYSIPLGSHKGRLKIGSATTNHPNPTEDEIKFAAVQRIKQQTKTADISFTLEHVELAVTNKGNYFADGDVHQVLIRSGYKRKSENVKNVRSEWFEVDLEKAKNAIKAVKEGRQALTTEEKVKSKTTEFPFRPNQLSAIEATMDAIKKKRPTYLWNAKMRFGKTSAAMQVAKKSKMQKVLIVTHRPSVGTDWFNDFNEIFSGSDYQFSSKTRGENISTLIKESKKFVYFTSLQDLRLSKRVVEDGSSGSKAGGFDKNDEIFDTVWDMLIVDEAHEGTQSQLGNSALEKIQKNFTLYLSGTPFNILHKQDEEDVYTWDYVMEQEAKLNWDEQNPGVPNPYAELPALSIFTYHIDTFKSHIGDFGDDFKDALDGAFKFHEFFRLKKDEKGNDVAEFVHQEMVKKFLDLLVDNTLATKFPYATEAYRNHNKHSLWLLPPRIKVIEAMEKLLKAHSVFGTANFGIVNISGNNNDDEDKDAKEKVTKAVKKYDYTITLTAQRLTTGASVPEWTAVFMMSDTSSATTYLQTAFRCQTPAKIDGKLKTQAYVFDFAPDRTLRLVAEAIELNHKPGKTNSIDQKVAMEKFLNFCPILAASSGSMKPYDVSGMLRQLKRAIAERVYRSGFEDPKLYNDELLQLSEVDIKRFNDLRAVVGASNTKVTNEIKINELGLDSALVKEAEKAEIKNTTAELTEEQKDTLKKLQEARKQKQSAISILRAVSIRMPMLVYGANVSIREDITLNKFVDLVDEESWNEFMPAGLSKEQFCGFTKYYDEDVFKNVAHSIRAKAFDCDELLPTERIEAIAEIFSTFKNPDKETVLTPWSVVNLHLTKAFGGHNFSSGEKDKHDKPVWVSKDVDTSVWEQNDTKILEINSKSGMYPLLAAYNVYTRKLKNDKRPEEKISYTVWKEVLEENIYVLCKSPMAKSITYRTLVGYRKDTQPNIVYIENLVQKLQKKEQFKDHELKNELLDKFKLAKDMKFTAVVGNPPYQINTETNFATPVYHLFFDAAKSLGPDYVSLIHPARFLFNAGATPKEWNRQMLNDPHLSVAMYESNSQKIFSGVDIKGGICVTLWNKNKPGEGLGGSFVSNIELKSILDKTKSKGIDSIMKPQSKTNKPIDLLFPAELRLRPNYFEKFPNYFKVNHESGFDISIIGLEKGNKRSERFAERKLINDPNLAHWKVFITKSNGTGSFGEILSTPIVAGPDMGCTGSFIQIGSFESKSIATNCLNYIKTKFARSLLSTLKVTQDNPITVWKNLPLQDFTRKSDINWSKSIAEIDQQLYKKYGLDKTEIDFIEKNVKPMS